MAIRVLGVCSAAACLSMALFSLAAPGGEESPPVERTPAERPAAEGTATGRAWSSPRQASEGPTLDEAWFRGRKAVVYLMPPGGGQAMRPVAGAVMRDLWAAGDWETDHVFVGGAVSAPIFAISKRIGTRDAEREVDRVALRRGEPAADIAKAVRPHVFCVHDREASLWQELLGPGDADAASDGTDAEPPIAVLVLDGGRVVGAVEIDRETVEEPGRTAAQVKRLLATEKSIASR